jgi:NAD(P)-dependent dehydrogenase (short-subunit alcohol dehydrogenase family)
MAPQSFFAIIAGVGAGTGKALALRFAKAYPVVLLARKPDSYNDIVSEIEKSGGKAVGVSADTADSESVVSAFNTIKQEFPSSKLAAAVYNVGSGFGMKPFLETNVKDLQSNLAANP